VAVSTTEAEYMATSEAVREALWFRGLLHELGEPQGAVQLYGDNQAAIKLTAEAMSAARSKHIDIHHHFVRQRVRLGQVVFSFIGTAHMAADVLTKALTADKHYTCCDLMGLK
jgi:hypothetical protein